MLPRRTPRFALLLELVLGAIWAVLYWQARARAVSGEAVLRFEQGEEPEVSGLGLFRDGVLPRQAGE